MPLYAYRCGNCDYEFDARHGFDSRDNAHCPQCGSVARRLISAIAVTGLKGSPQEVPGGCGAGVCAMRQEAGLPCSMND